MGDWLAGLELNVRARIATRIDRLSLGNFGDCKPLREGVSELRIDWGLGYRLYYANFPISSGRLSISNYKERTRKP